MEKLVAVLYSHEQKCFHVETLNDYCIANIKATVTKTKPEFRLIDVCDNYDKANKSISKFEKLFNQQP